MARTLLRNGAVLTMDPDLRDFESADVLIEDDRIEAVGEHLDAGGAEVVDASDRVVMPGLVNSHAHLFQTGLRGIAGDWTLGEYFEKMLAALRPQFRPEDLYLGNLFGAFEQLNAGVTSVLDWCHCTNTPDHSDRAVDALAESGIRAVFAHGPPGVDIAEWYGDSDRSHPEDVRRLAEERLPAGDGRVQLGMALRGPDLSSYEVTAHDLRLARELGVPASMHVGVATYEGPEDHEIPRLADDGLLGPAVNFVHANHLADDVYPLIGEAGVSVSVTPEVEMQMGHGLPATGKVLDAGGRMVLGSDVVSAIGSDMFSQMRFALQVQRGLDNAEVLAEGRDVESLSIDARDVLRAATIDGARALRMGDEVGSLSPGKRADVITIRTDAVGVTPVHDPVSTVVLHASPADVDSVWVGGELVKSGGSLLHPAVREERDALAASGRRLLDDAGLAP